MKIIYKIKKSMKNDITNVHTPTSARGSHNRPDSPHVPSWPQLHFLKGHHSAFHKVCHFLSFSKNHFTTLKFLNTLVVNIWELRICGIIADILLLQLPSSAQHSYTWNPPTACGQLKSTLFHCCSLVRFSGIYFRNLTLAFHMSQT